MPDMYAKSSTATYPDWYQRRIDTIRSADTKYRLWSWEKTDRPHEKQTFNNDHKQMIPIYRGFQAVPRDITGQVAMPKWGIYHPDSYQEGARVEPLPPLRTHTKHI